MLGKAEAYGLEFLFPTHDTVIGASLRDFGEFARPESDLIASYLAGAGGMGSFVDVGANIGTICLPVAKALPALQVIAIEAHRGLHGILAANALTNGLYNVQAYHAAAGGAPSLVRFPAPALTAHGNFRNLRMGMRDTLEETVQMVTLDALAPPETRFIKIDVEGFEMEVLKGAHNTISSIRPCWFVEANNGNYLVARQAMSLLLEAEYRLYWFFAPFVTQKAAGGRLASMAGDTNFLALPPGMENIWGLKQIDDCNEPRPSAIESYGYLRRYE